MSETLDKTESEEADAFDELYGLTEELVAQVEAAVDEGESPEEIRTLVLPLHAADLADLLEALKKDERLAVIHALGEELDSDLFAYIDESVRESIVDELPNSVRASIVRDL